MLPLKLLKQQGHLISSAVKHSKILSPRSIVDTALNLNIGVEQTDESFSTLAHYWNQILQNQGVHEPMESVEHICAHVIGSTVEMASEKDNTSSQLLKLKNLCKKRLKMSSDECIYKAPCNKSVKNLIKIPGLCIPKPDREILVHLLLKRIEQSSSNTCNILEIGCGLGAVSLILLLACPKARIVAMDDNIETCYLTLQSAKNLGIDDRLTLIHASIADNGKISILSYLCKKTEIDIDKQHFDFIVSNLPHSESLILSNYKKKIDFDPNDISTVKSILNCASNQLEKEGIILLKIYANESEEIKEIIKADYQTQLKHNNTFEDLNCNQKVIEISKLI